MDLAKKRRVELSNPMSDSDAEKILEPFTKEQLLPTLRAAVLRHPDVLDSVLAVAEDDPSLRTLFVGGLSVETNTQKLRQAFSVYGELEGVTSIVVPSQISGGYGLVTFKHVDSAFLALKDPNKEIERGPLGFDKRSGKGKGFALFVYKTETGARASLVNPIKTIGGHEVICKLVMPSMGGSQNIEDERMRAEFEERELALLAVMEARLAALRNEIMAA